MRRLGSSLDPSDGMTVGAYLRNPWSSTMTHCSEWCGRRRSTGSGEGPGSPSPTARCQDLSGWRLGGTGSKASQMIVTSLSGISRRQVTLTRHRSPILGAWHGSSSAWSEHLRSNSSMGCSMGDKCRFKHACMVCGSAQPMVGNH